MYFSRFSASLELKTKVAKESCQSSIYRTVKNFGGKKIWRIESLQSIGGKKFGE